MSDSANIFITEYNVSLSDPITGSVHNSTTVSTCGGDTCDAYITPTSNSSVLCPSATITVTADNGYGQRLLSDPIAIGMLVPVVGNACTQAIVMLMDNSSCMANLM